MSGTRRAHVRTLADGKKVQVREHAVAFDAADGLHTSPELAALAAQSAAWVDDHPDADGIAVTAGSTLNAEATMDALWDGYRTDYDAPAHTWGDTRATREMSARINTKMMDVPTADLMDAAYADAGSVIPEPYHNNPNRVDGRWERAWNGQWIWHPDTHTSLTPEPDVDADDLWDDPFADAEASMRWTADDDLDFAWAAAPAANPETAAMFADLDNQHSHVDNPMSSHYDPRDPHERLLIIANLRRDAIARMANMWAVGPDHTVQTRQVQSLVARNTSPGGLSLAAPKDPEEAVLSRFAEASYEATQEWFSERGISHITVHRGEGRSDVPAGRAEVVTRPLSSWTAESFTADRFAFDNSGWIDSNYATVKPLRYTAKVPVRDVFSHAHTGFGTLSESEFVLLQRGSRSCDVTVL
jgi:hypothetical protein